MEAVWRQHRAGTWEAAVNGSGGGGGSMYRAAAKGGGGGMRWGQQPIDVGGDTRVRAGECFSWKFLSAHQGGKVCE